MWMILLLSIIAVTVQKWVNLRLNFFKNTKSESLETNHFLGIRILRDRPNRKLWLIQDSYIENFAHKFNITVAKAPKTPLPATTPQLYSGQATPQQTYGYQQRIGSLNFPAVVTRPDIARACSKLSEYLQNP